MPITETLAITGLSNIILGDYYRVKHTIGCGSFGNVCLAVDVRTEDVSRFSRIYVHSVTLGLKYNHLRQIFRKWQ